MMLSRLMAQMRSASSCCAYVIVRTLSLLFSAGGGADSPAEPAYATSTRPRINPLLNATLRCTAKPIPTDALLGRRLSMRLRRS